MMTQTHFLVAAALLCSPKRPPKQNAAVLLGAFAPDFAIYAMFIWSKIVGIPESQLWNVVYFSEPMLTYTAIANSAPLYAMIAILGIAMVLPLGLYVTVNNLRALDLQQQEWGTLTVFLVEAADEADARALTARIENDRGAGVVPVSPEQGLLEFREASGFGQALDLFEENPLPWVLQVTPEAPDEAGLEGAVEELGAWLEGQPEVGQVQVDYRWLKRLAGLLALGNAFVTVLTVMFSLAVVVVVANTIRLDVANRSDEIEVLHMVGAGSSFIRQPFLYTGFWYGLLGEGS